MATKHQILILQHPQEPDKELGSAKLAAQELEGCTLKVGLSWPNLKKALGREAIPSRWAVLYLGSGIKGNAPTQAKGLRFVKKDSTPLIPAESAKVRSELEGIILLDGTWSQAKTLWWRNAWLLKVRRAVLVPSHPSLYKELRKEPRRECLSTIESVAEALDALGEAPEVGARLRTAFSGLLDEERARRKTGGRPAFAAETTPDAASDENEE